MTERSWFWGGTTVGDAALVAPYGAPYTDDMFSDLYAFLFSLNRVTDGVIHTENPLYNSMLAVTNPAGTTIRVANGMALVDGKVYLNTANIDLNTSGDGNYSVVLRKTWATQIVRAAIRSQGVTQVDGTTWEIELARVAVVAGVHTLTDMRRRAFQFKAGVTVPQLVQRQGGHSTEWANSGLNNYIPTYVKMQCGCIAWTDVAPASSGTIVVTFPEQFIDYEGSHRDPLVWAVFKNPDGDPKGVSVEIWDVDHASFTICWYADPDKGFSSTVFVFNWFAIGAHIAM